MFDRFFGNTHALDHLTGAVFLAMIDTPSVTVAELAQRLAANFPMHSATEMQSLVERAHAQLSAIELTPEST